MKIFIILHNHEDFVEMSEVRKKKHLKTTRIDELKM